DRVPRVVVPCDDLDLREELVKLRAPGFLGRVRVAGVPAVAQVAEGDGEVRSGCVELVQAFPHPAPGTEVPRDRKLERDGALRGSRRPDERDADESHGRGQKDRDGSAWTKRRSHGPPALFPVSLPDYFSFSCHLAHKCTQGSNQGSGGPTKADPPWRPTVS